jgi:DNA-binding response OmpR family regulator
LPFTRNEYRLLAYLGQQRGRVFSRDHLRECLYPHDVDVSSNVIEVMIYNIRQKLRRQGVPSLIRTVRGQGYLID